MHNREEPRADTWPPETETCPRAALIRPGGGTPILVEREPLLLQKRSQAGAGLSCQPDKLQSALVQEAPSAVGALGGAAHHMRPDDSA